ncbi:MAG TPA: peptidyl-prolyl cis-trans isomerase [Vicinamibacterales bacterium]|nr:peptidyl-prolyl cis-trans isomerase [Vicinamibacterales bacterium]
MKYRIAIAALTLGIATVSLQADIVEQVLVKVNGEIITKTELEARQISALRQKNPNLRPDSDAALKQALAEVTPAVIVDAVDEMLMVQKGKELGFTMSTDRFNSIVENIKKENKIESDEQLQAALKQEGMTMADLRRQLERTMLVQQVQQQEIMQKLQVTDTELKTYYEAHKDEFGTVPQITLREITINVPVAAQGINVAADDAAKAKAEEVRAKILANEPFARLAADYSDSGSKANGGLVGPLAKSDLSEDLQKEIAGLKTGGVTPVIRTSRGYQIIKIESLSDTTTKPFEEARGDIADKIAGGKRQGEYRKFILKLRAEAIIDWKNDEIKKAYEVGVTQEAAGARDQGPGLRDR